LIEIIDKNYKELASKGKDESKGQYISTGKQGSSVNDFYDYEMARQQDYIEDNI